MSKLITAELNTNLIRLFGGTYESQWEITEIADNGEELEVEYKHNDLMAGIAREYQNHASEIVRDIELPFIKKIEFTGGFHSPREYNFSTDELDFKLELDIDELVKTLKTYKDNAEFRQYLIDHYRSRDGFISFTPDNYEELAKNIIEEGEDFDQSLGAFITYLTSDKFQEIENDIWEDWQGNGYGGTDYKIIEELAIDSK